MDAKPIVDACRQYYHEGHTFDINFRLQALARLKKSIQQHEQDLLKAIHTDLGKSASEAYMCEVGLALSEISHFQRRLRRWARNERKITPLTNFAAKSMIVHEPYGVVLIMSPWNYPVLLSLEPLVGAIAAGNTVVLKPSAYSPATSAVLKTVIEEALDPRHVAAVTGGRAENQSLLDQTWDYIFFTGSVSVGKMVMEKASHNLTPVTLELGGKSPCVISHTADLRIAARRIVFGKYLNCGQTCIAPDYVLVEKSVHARFVELLKEEAVMMYGEDPIGLRSQGNKDYGKMINQKHFDRVWGLIDPKKVVLGGEKKDATLQIQPTILDSVQPSDAVMQEEIFGPLLPIIEVASMDEAYDFIQSRPHPLALYLFTNDSKEEKRFLQQVPFGGGCVNDTIIHIATNNLPFGGVGASGMGSYHGKQSFLTFSHQKAVVKKYTWLDLVLRYQPYCRWKDTMVRFFLH